MNVRYQCFVRGHFTVLVLFCNPEHVIKLVTIICYQATSWTCSFCLLLVRACVFVLCWPFIWNVANGECCQLRLLKRIVSVISGWFGWVLVPTPALMSLSNVPVKILEGCNQFNLGLSVAQSASVIFTDTSNNIPGYQYRTWQARLVKCPCFIGLCRQCQIVIGVISVCVCTTTNRPAICHYQIACRAFH